MSRAPSSREARGHLCSAGAWAPAALAGAEYAAPSAAAPSQPRAALGDITNVRRGAPGLRPPLCGLGVAALGLATAQGGSPWPEGACRPSPPLCSKEVEEDDGDEATEAEDEEDSVDSAGSLEDDDAQRAAEYTADAFDARLRLESRKRVGPRFLDAQREVNPEMRGVLVDWIVGVHRTYRMRSETLYLTISIVDRFLARRQVRRREVQLLGVVALFIASKYEETRAPRIADLSYITANAYTAQDILGMECAVLAALEYAVAAATPAHFADDLERAAGCGEVQRSLVRYLVELALVEAHMVRHEPSQLVSAALLLSNELLHRKPLWSRAVARSARRSEVDVRPVAEEMREVLRAAPRAKLQSVRSKFRSPHHDAVAELAWCRCP